MRRKKSQQARTVRDRHGLTLFTVRVHAGPLLGAVVGAESGKLDAQLRKLFRGHAPLQTQRPLQLSLLGLQRRAGLGARLQLTAQDKCIAASAARVEVRAAAAKGQAQQAWDAMERKLPAREHVLEIVLFHPDALGVRKPCAPADVANQFLVLAIGHERSVSHGHVAERGQVEKRPDALHNGSGT